MELRLKPETELRLMELATRSGRAPDELIEDVVAGYLAELSELRDTFNRHYDDFKSGRVKPIDGEAFFEGLRQREDELMNKNKSK